MTSLFKHFKNGTHRARDPAETINLITPHLIEMGITRVANVTGLDRLGIPVVNAIRPNSRSLSVAQGKGLTLDAAKASAIMEAVESFHAEQIELPVKTASYVKLASSETPCDVDGLALFKDTSFNHSLPITWIEGTNLIDQEKLWVPFEVVHTDYTLPKLPDAGCFVASTNGLASGNHHLEATIHGICEVIERDAHTLWEQKSLNNKAITRIDPATVDDPYCSGLIRKLMDAKMTVAIWNMTSDVGVATFYCMILDERNNDGHSGAGAGTHPVREIALLRALTEAVQVRTNYITGARDDLELEEYHSDGIAAKNSYANHLMNSGISKARSFQSVASYEFKTFEEDIEFLLNSLNAVGIRQVIVIDLSRENYNIAVVRVIIPGLEGPHDHDDYCMGRRSKLQAESSLS